MCKFLAYLVALLMPATVLSQFSDSSADQSNGLMLILNVMPAKSATLSWKTDPEITGGYFIVERRSDSGSFQPMVSIKVSAESFDYKVADEKPFPGLNHYRIRLVNQQGLSSYSPVVSGDMSVINFCRFYPNPADDHLIISARRQAEVKIYNRSGVLSLTKVVDKGLTALDVSSLSKGIYVLMVISMDTKMTKREILYKN